MPPSPHRADQASPHPVDPATDAVGAAVSSGEGETRAPLRLLIVAGTRTRAEVLRRRLDGSVQVVALAGPSDGVEELVRRHAPAVVLLDLDLDAGGLDIIESVMAARPTPIVVCGAAAQRPEAALAAGAVDVVDPAEEDPTVLGAAAGTGDALVRHLRIAARVRVISHPRARLRRTAPQAPPEDPRGRGPLVIIGASTGGPPALAEVLSALPRGFEAPVVVVQHMADGFVEGLARWLHDTCRLPVVVAVDGERLRSGVVHLAPAGRNLRIEAGARVRLLEPPPDQFSVPGIDEAFASAAEAVGPAVVGVLLTGMGRDGAEGLRVLRRAGAVTIGQDEATSVVWGMPGAAAELDAVELELPLELIGPQIVRSVRRRRHARIVAVAP